MINIIILIYEYKSVDKAGVVYKFTGRSSRETRWLRRFSLGELFFLQAESLAEDDMESHGYRKLWLFHQSSSQGSLTKQVTGEAMPSKKLQSLLFWRIIQCPKFLTPSPHLLQVCHVSQFSEPHLDHVAWSLERDPFLGAPLGMQARPGRPQITPPTFPFLYATRTHEICCPLLVLIC